MTYAFKAKRLLMPKGLILKDGAGKPKFKGSEGRFDGVPAHIETGASRAVLTKRNRQVIEKYGA